MYKTGVYFGRFCPPHRGHLYQIIQASTKCEKLIVVISDNSVQTEALCRADHLPVITYKLRKQWISQQIQDMGHIQVRVLDETDIPLYPDGWPLWSERMKQVVPEKIDISLPPRMANLLIYSHALMVLKKMEKQGPPPP